MADTSLILVKSIVACYLNKKLKNESLDIKEHIDFVLKNIKMPSNLIGNNGSGDIARGLRETLDWLNGLPPKTDIPEEDFLTRLRINLGTETHHLMAIKQAIADTSDLDMVRSRIIFTINEVKAEMNKDRLSDTIRKANAKSRSDDDFLDRAEFIEGFINELQELKNEFRTDVSESEQRLHFADTEALEKAFIRAQENFSPEGVLRTGLQGLNKMMGIGGFPRGYYVNFGALTHNYKSGILLDMFVHIARFNKPKLRDPNKKPALLRVSFENQQEQDLSKMYKDIYEQKTGQECDLSKVNPAEAAKFIYDHLSETGFEIFMEFFSPNDFTVDDMIALLDDYEKRGYEVQLLDLDYLELIVKASKLVRPDKAITDAADKLRGYCYPKGITVLTAHQLSTEAQQLSREGTANFAVKVSEGGWYMNCKSLHTKLDLEVLMHIHKHQGDSYLTFARGKMRNGETVPIAHRSFAYKMEKIGTIHPDIMEDDSRAIYQLSTYLRQQGGSGGGFETSDDW